MRKMWAWQSKGWSELQMSNMQLLSSLAILIIPWTARLTTEVSGWYAYICQAFVPLMHRKDNVNHNHLCLHKLVGDRSPNGCRPIVDFVTTSRRLVSNFNDDTKFSRRQIGEWLAIGLRLVCNWSATDCRSKIWLVIGCRWLSMVVGCHWSATGCRYSVTEALLVRVQYSTSSTYACYVWSADWAEQ